MKSLKCKETIKYVDGSVVSHYNNFNIEKPASTKILVNNVSKQNQCRKIIEAYIDTHNLIDYSLFYNKQFDVIGITYNV